MLLLSCCLFAQNDSIKLRPKQQIEYRHNISAQVNPAGDYLDLMISNQTTESNYVNWHGAIRYTYTVHPNILVGGEASYTSFEYYNAEPFGGIKKSLKKTDKKLYISLIFNNLAKTKKLNYIIVCTTCTQIS